MKLKEAQEREANIERLHNTMIKAFKDDDVNEKEAKFVKEYEYLSEQHRNELNDTVKTYEIQISHLKEKNNELQEKCSSLNESCDSMQKEIKRLFKENTVLEKNMLILEKEHEVVKRVEIEKFVVKNSKDRENVENK